jgi:hypothetical protein
MPLDDQPSNDGGRRQRECPSYQSSGRHRYSETSGHCAQTDCRKQDLERSKGENVRGLFLDVPEREVQPDFEEQEYDAQFR